MRKNGVVIQFDGFTGKILSSDDNCEYTILKHEVIDNIKEKDNVSFEPDIISHYEFTIKIARFIKKNI